VTRPANVVEAPDAAAARVRRPRPWVRALEIAAALALVYFLGSYLAAHWGELRAFRWRPNGGLLVAATAFTLAGHVLFASMWIRLLRTMGEPADERAGFHIWFVSLLTRYVPGKVWQVSSLAYLSRRRGISPVHALGAAVHLQVLMVAVAVLLLLATLPAQISLVGGRRVAMGMASIAAVLVTLFVSPLFDWAYAKGLGVLGRPVPLGRLPVRRKALFGALAAAAWLLHGASFGLFIRGTTGEVLHPVTGVGIYLAGYLAGLLAFFLPAGLGAREGVSAYLLGAHLPVSISLAVVIVYRVWLVLLDVLLAGASTLAVRGSGDAPPSSGPPRGG
jgi:hypothetical protein